MNRLWLRNAEKLTFVDPTPYLIQLRRIEIEIALCDAPSQVKDVLNNSVSRVLRRGAFS